MAESTLSLDLDDLRSEVGQYFSFGQFPAAWNGDQAAMVERSIRNGLRQFLYPPPLPGESKSHEWTFLREKQTIAVYADVSGTVGSGTTGTTLVADAAIFKTDGTMVGQTITFTTSSNTYTISTVDSTTQVTLTAALASADDDVGDTFTVEAGDYSVPDNVGDIRGSLYYDKADQFHEITRTSASDILRLRGHAGGIDSGRPQFYAFCPRDTGGSTGQRFQILLWPEPDGNYTLHYQKVINIDALTDTSKFPPGGLAHGDTIRASILAAAEELIDDAPRIQRKRELFFERLRASVSLDRRKVADSFGLMRDPSVLGRISHRTLPAVTVGGRPVPLIRRVKDDSNPGTEFRFGCCGTSSRSRNHAGRRHDRASRWGCRVCASVHLPTSRRNCWCLKHRSDLRERRNGSERRLRRHHD